MRKFEILISAEVSASDEASARAKIKDALEDPTDSYSIDDVTDISDEDEEVEEEIDDEEEEDED